MKATYYIHIDNLRMHAYHGVLKQEREVGNDYIVNVKVEYPWGKAVESDDVADTLNYAELADVVCEEMNIPSNLLEHVAGRIAAKVKSVFKEVISIEIDIKKVVPPIKQDTEGCAVTLKMTY